jgi:hypothetical protein
MGRRLEDLRAILDGLERSLDATERLILALGSHPERQRHQSCYYQMETLRASLDRIAVLAQERILEADEARRRNGGVNRTGPRRSSSVRDGPLSLADSGRESG